MEVVIVYHRNYTFSDPRFKYSAYFKACDSFNGKPEFDLASFSENVCACEEFLRLLEPNNTHQFHPDITYEAFRIAEFLDLKWVITKLIKPLVKIFECDLHPEFVIKTFKTFGPYSHMICRIICGYDDESGKLIFPGETCKPLPVNNCTKRFFVINEVESYNDSPYPVKAIETPGMVNYDAQQYIRYIGASMSETPDIVERALFGLNKSMWDYIDPEKFKLNINKDFTDYKYWYLICEDLLATALERYKHHLPTPDEVKHLKQNGITLEDVIPKSNISEFVKAWMGNGNSKPKSGFNFLGENSSSEVYKLLSTCDISYISIDYIKDQLEKHGIGEVIKHNVKSTFLSNLSRLYEKN